MPKNKLMKLIQKQFTLKNKTPLTADYIENEIQKHGFELLRWAIVKAENEELLIDSVIIN